METVVDVKFPDFSTVAQRLREGMPGLIASVLQRQRAMIFTNEGAYHGRPRWEPLKHRKGQILFDTGTLSQSIGPSNATPTEPGRKTGTIVRLSDGIVTIGTSIAYAAVHDNGATIKAHDIYMARSERTGRFTKTTKKTIFQERIHIPSYKIPARPFSDFTAHDETDLRSTVETYISQTIGGAT